MFIGAASLMVIYILMGLYMMLICGEASIFSNPLMYGLIVIIWPIFVIIGLCIIVKEWVKSIVEYYKKKGKKKE